MALWRLVGESALRWAIAAKEETRAAWDDLDSALAGVEAQSVMNLPEGLRPYLAAGYGKIGETELALKDGRDCLTCPERGAAKGTQQGHSRRVAWGVVGLRSLAAYLIRKGSQPGSEPIEAGRSPSVCEGWPQVLSHGLSEPAKIDGTNTRVSWEAC